MRHMIDTGFSLLLEYRPNSAGLGVRILARGAKNTVYHGEAGILALATVSVAPLAFFHHIILLGRDRDHKQATH